MLRRWQGWGWKEQFHGNSWFLILLVILCSKSSDESMSTPWQTLTRGRSGMGNSLSFLGFFPVDIVPRSEFTHHQRWQLFYQQSAERFWLRAVALAAGGQTYLLTLRSAFGQVWTGRVSSYPRRDGATQGAATLASWGFSPHHRFRPLSFWYGVAVSLALCTLCI